MKTNNSAFRVPHSRAFTLIEMLAVIAIIMILAGLILAGVNAARNRAHELRARRDVAQLKTAWDTYYADYQGFPDPAQITGNSIEDGYMVTGKDVILILRGRENHNNQNPKLISYMDFHQSTDTFNDPWGKRYRISLDTDYDGDVTIPGGTLRQSVAAWSAGKDGNDGTSDDIKTWR